MKSKKKFLGIMLEENILGVKTKKSAPGMSVLQCALIAVWTMQQLITSSFLSGCNI